MITTKLIPPRYTRQLVERQRLIARLEAGRHCNLIFIRASGGFGKTTLVAQWRQMLITEGCRVGWLSLDNSDNEESQFLAYWMAALERAGCKFGQGTLDVYQRNAPNSALDFVEALVNDLAAVEDEIYLVLDDFHCITHESVHATVSRVLAYAPANFHLIIASRVPLPFSLVSMRVHDLVVKIGTKDLRFTPDEANQFLTHRLPNRLNAEQRQSLHDAADGWPAGLQMLAMSWDEKAGRIGMPTTPLSGDWSEEILEGLFRQLPDDIMDVLLRLCILERFNASLCEAVTGARHPDKLLTRLSKESTLLMEHDEGWYSFHPMLSEFLRRRLAAKIVSNLAELHARAVHLFEEQEHNYSLQSLSNFAQYQKAISAIDLASAHIKASVWFERHGYLVEAVQHALYAGPDTGSYALIERCAMTLVEQGLLDSVLQWSENIPSEELAKLCRLNLARFWCHLLRTELEPASELLRLLEPGIHATSAISPFEFAVCSALLACTSERGIEAILLLETWPLSDDTLHNRAACNALTYAYVSAGNHQKALEIQVRSHGQVSNSMRVLPHAYSRAFVGWSYAMQGNLEQAELLLRKDVSAADESHGRRSAPACMPAGYLAELLYMRNDLNELDALLAGRLDVMNKMVFSDSLTRAYLSGARLRFIQDDKDAAYDLLEKLRTYGFQRGLSRPACAALGERVRMDLLSGNEESAQAQLQHLEEIAKPKNLVIPSNVIGNMVDIPLTAGLARARFMLARGDTDACLAALNSISATADMVRRFDFQIAIGILRSAALYESGKMTEACSLLQEWVSRGATSGAIRPFIDEGKLLYPILESCRVALADSGKVEVLTHLEAILDAFAAPTFAETQEQQSGKSFRRNMAVEELSPRENDILLLLSRGLSNKRIASAMNLSVHTVKWHLKNLFAKLGASSREQVADKARLAGILRNSN